MALAPIAGASHVQPIATVPYRPAGMFAPRCTPAIPADFMVRTAGVAFTARQMVNQKLAQFH
jgi:hypothetical protein